MQVVISNYVVEKFVPLRFTKNEFISNIKLTSNINVSCIFVVVNISIMLKSLEIFIIFFQNTVETCRSINFILEGLKNEKIAKT